ncbi:hypothetical protein Gpo141_00007456 [Globisporangium polare]
MGKVLHAINHSNKPLYFVFCTISHCTCSLCMEWIGVERFLFAGSTTATFGVMVVDANSTRLDEFCSNWDCVGQGYFGDLPSAVTFEAMFNYDERTSYTLRNGGRQGDVELHQGEQLGLGFPRRGR